MEECRKASLQSLVQALGVLNRAEREAAKQKYQQEYERGEQALSWGLKTFLNQLPGLAHGEGINRLLKQRGDIGVLRQRIPDACPAIMELIVRELKLSPHTIAAALGLPPPARDALDTLLLTVVRERAHEARNGLLPLHCIVDAVNVGCAPNDGLTPKFIGGRMRALGYAFTSHHPVSVILIPRLLPPEADTVPTFLLPAPEESSARENGSPTHTENTE